MTTSSSITSLRDTAEPAALLLDEGGTISDCTPWAEHIFGSRREQLLAQPVSKVLPELAGFPLIERGETNARLRLLSQLDANFKARRSDATLFMCRLSLSIVGSEHARSLRLTVIPITAPFPPATDAGEGPATPS